MKQQELAEVEPEPPSSWSPSLNRPSGKKQFHNFYSPETYFPAKEKTQSDFITSCFRHKHYPGVSDKSWNDWRWQLKNRICRAKDLESYLTLSSREKAVMSMENILPLSITPYYMSLVHETDYKDPVRKCVIPTEYELVKGPGEKEDPLHEDQDSPVPGIVHRYPDRVLFLATGFCSTYCRYCTRSRIVGQRGAYGIDRWNSGMEYIKNDNRVRDVLISGGDPLTMSDEQLEYIIKGLRAIKHVEIIRIGSKVPAVLPQRINRKLCAMLKKYHPVFMSLHFTHPDELTVESVKACVSLADAGIPMGSQTVLLKGINDDQEIMKNLNHRLLQARVRPYYLYQCDPVPGSGHFRTTMEKGLEVIQGLRGHTSGYAVPQYVIDLPGGGGKTPVLPDYYQGQTIQGQVFKNFENKLFVYPEAPDPAGISGLNMITSYDLSGGEQ